MTRFAALLALAALAPAQKPADTGLPVREVTVFKDGHAYLLRDRPLAQADRQQLVLDELPAPVLGTFWPYASGGARLIAAKAGRDKVSEERTAASLAEFARANVGKPIAIVDVSNARIEGELVGVPRREDDADATSARPQPAVELLLIRTGVGTRAVPLSQVRDLEIKGELRSTLAVERQRERLTLDVQGGGDGARVGVMYVQRGLRWIPSYRLDIDGAGKARVQLQASLVNDLIDLDGATVHLVIGVPKFEFEGMVDPISLQQEVARVASRAQQGSQFSNMLSNSLMTQSAGYRSDGNTAAADTPTVEGGAANEDLFVFTVRDVSLKQGERMVLPISSFELPYRDVYTLEVPFAPPMEFRQQLQSERVLELARELAAPKAMHVLRLQNKTQAPLTTAPALVLANGRILAQGRMLYTPIGAETDLEINTAIDVCVDTEEHETGRTPNAVRFDNNQYGRIDLVGTIALRNDKKQPIELEVTRRVLGLGDSVGQDGSMQQLDLVNVWRGEARPGWWSWWNWPYWWFHFNGFAEFRWKLQLAPGARLTLESGWHYFWR